MKILSALGLAVLISGSARAASTESVIGVVAAGSVGDWGTVVELANPTDSELTGRYFFGDFDCIDPSGLLCRTALYDVLPKHTLEVAFDGPTFAGLKMLELTLVPTGPALLPTVRAFARNRSTGSVNEILASSIGAIRNRQDPLVLAFPGLPIEPRSHVNVALLSIANVDQAFGPRSVGFTAKIELLNAQGDLIGETTVSGCGGHGLCGDVFLGDVAAAIGLGNVMTSATLRVTQLSGGDAIWGQAVVVNSEGFVTTVPGFNP